MDLNKYQELAVSTAIYGAGNKIVYPALGLAGEAGETCEKVKKTLRDNNGVFDEERVNALKKEIGDVLWYCAALSRDLGLSLNDIAEANIAKLQARRAAGTIQGNGDNR
jgi:NTP pyrophosphatase (non-canonical NTP hydrolase)